MKVKSVQVSQNATSVTVSETYIDKGPRIVRNPLTGNRIRATRRYYNNKIELDSAHKQSRLEKRIQQLIERASK